MKVTTSTAALATLTVSTAELQSDVLLQVIVKLAEPTHQLTVKTAKKATLSLELPDGSMVTHRNAIVRFLAGMGLHNALDHAPYYLLGGHSIAAKIPSHAVALASIASWQSAANHVSSHQKDTNEVTAFLQQLNAHLQNRNFVVPSCAPTCADIDIAAVLLQTCLEDIPSYPNVHRYVIAVSDVIQHQFGVKLNKTVDPLPPNKAPPLLFFGSETDPELPSFSSTPKPKAAQQQQTQKGGGDQTKKGDTKNKNEGGKKKNKQPPPQAKQQPQPAASFDISALDIRVGKINKIWPHPDAEKLYCEEIDLGEASGPRQIASGLRPFYATPDLLEGKLVIVLCNLKKRNLVGFPSHGMVLCASNADHTAVEIMEPPATAQIGERVVFDDFPGDPEPENKVAKKKIFEAVAPDLKTDAQGICVWKGAIGKTSAGAIQASKGMADAQVS